MKKQNYELMKAVTAPGVGSVASDIRIEYHTIGDRHYLPLMHWHTYCEFEFVLSGHGVHTLNNVPIPISRGAAFLCMVDDFHKIKNEPSEQMSVVSVKFQSSFINKDLLSKLEKISMHRYCTFEKEEDILKISNMLDLLNEIQSTEYNSNSLKKVLLESTLNLILAMFILQCMNNESSAVNKDKNEYRIQKAITYIHKNFATDISQVEVAEHIGLSVYYFSTLFKQHLNCNYSSYLLDLRLNYARNLIQNEHIYSVNTVSKMVGFSCTSYFIKAFKTKFKITPKDMISQVKTDDR